MNKLTACILCCSLFFIFSASALAAESAKPSMFVGIETNPITRTALLRTYAGMAARVCENAWADKPALTAECLATVSSMSSRCESALQSRIPESVDERETAIGFAKEYTKCVFADVVWH